jgi:hypothetical protein
VNFQLPTSKSLPTNLRTAASGFVSWFHRLDLIWSVVSCRPAVAATPRTRPCSPSLQRTKRPLLRAVSAPKDPTFNSTHLLTHLSELGKQQLVPLRQPDQYHCPKHTVNDSFTQWKPPQRPKLGSRMSYSCDEGHELTGQAFAEPTPEMGHVPESASTRHRAKKGPAPVACLTCSKGKRRCEPSGVPGQACVRCRRIGNLYNVSCRNQLNKRTQTLKRSRLWPNENEL